MQADLCSDFVEHVCLAHGNMARVWLEDLPELCLSASLAHGTRRESGFTATLQTANGLGRILQTKKANFCSYETINFSP